MQRKSISWAAQLIALTMIINGSAVALFAQDFTIHMQGDNSVEGTTYYVSLNAVRKTSPGLTDVIDRMDLSCLSWKWRTPFVR